MSDQELARPRQVTVAVVIIVLGSFFVLFTAWDEMARIHSLDTRERIEDMMGGFDLGTQQALLALRIAVLIAASCAVVAGVLGLQILKRNRAARIGLTVVAAPLFLTGTAIEGGGFAAAMVAAFAVLLWFQPARDWFDGKAPARRPAVDGPPQRAIAPPASPRRSGQSGRPDPVGQPGTVAQQTPPDAVNWPGNPYLRTEGPSRVRPPRLVAACLLTWIFGAVIGTISLILAVAMVGDPDAMIDQMRSQDPDLVRDLGRRELVAGVGLTGAVLFVWCSVASGLAIFAWLGRPWARLALLLAVAPAAVGLLIGAIAAVPLLIPAIGAIIATTSLMHPSTVEYFQRREPQ